MTDGPVEENGVERLSRLLDQCVLPAGGPAEAAERLIERLKRPARVALLGLPGSGKSAILNLLAGTIVVPETLRLPTIVVQYGQRDRMLCTLADGRTEAIEGSDLGQVLTRNPALVTVERDLPALKVISLLEVSAGPMDAEQRRAAIWASKRADIVIWCTTSYLPKEQVVWDSMPDVVKDNGFLFLTKIDLLGSTEAATGMLDRVEQRAGEDFRQVFPISAKLARAAMSTGGSVDRNKFRESGASAVISTLKARVQAARRADMDTAEMLLARHVEAAELVAKRFAAPGTVSPVEAPAAAGWAPPPDPSPLGASQFDPSAIVPAVKTSVLAKATPPETLPPFTRAPDPIGAEAEFVARILAQTSAEPPVPPPALPEPPQAAPADLLPAPDVAADVALIVQPTAVPPRPSEADLSEAAALARPGNARLSERLRQSPEPDEIAAAALMPLRTTWKSRGEAADAPSGVTRPPPLVRRDIQRPAAMLSKTPLQAHPEVAKDPVALMPEPVPEPMPEPAPELIPEPVPVQESVAPQAEVVQPYPTEPRDLPAERVSVFGARKPVAEPPAPVSRTARPAEPVTRVRGPASSVRPAPEPASIAPHDLASPRVSSLRERQATATGPERRERPRISARVAPTPVAEATPAPVLHEETGLLDEAISLIIARSGELLQQIDPAEKPAVETILDHGRKTIEAVTDLLSRGNSPGLRRISTGLGDVLDLIRLMQLEKGHAPADDTLTLILQIRRDLETLRAA